MRRSPRLSLSAQLAYVGVIGYSTPDLELLRAKVLPGDGAGHPVYRQAVALLVCPDA